MEATHYAKNGPQMVPKHLGPLASTQGRDSAMSKYDTRAQKSGPTDSTDADRASGRDTSDSPTGDTPKIQAGSGDSSRSEGREGDKASEVSACPECDETSIHHVVHESHDWVCRHCSARFGDDDVVHRSAQTDGGHRNGLAGDLADPDTTLADIRNGGGA